MISALTVVGPGRMGLALGYALVQAEAVERLTFYGRRPEPPSHPVFMQGMARYVFGVERPAPDTQALLIAVADEAVPEIAHTLAAQGPAPEGCVALLLSGALTTDVLAPLHHQGYALGAFQVLQVVSHPITGAERIPGSHVAITGSPEATRVARHLAALLGCAVLEVPAFRRPLFDAAISLATGYLPTMLDFAARLMERSGVSYGDALQALTTLLRGRLAGMEEQGLWATVGGPLERGDLETVDLHMRAMDPDERRVYALHGRELLRSGSVDVDEDTRRELIRRFEIQMGE